MAINADDLESEPGTATGRINASSVSGYEIKIGDGDWQSVDTSGGLEYLDTDAPKGEITAVSTTASQGTSTEHVLLTASVDASSSAGTQTYQVRALNGLGAGPSSSVTGWRGTESAYFYHWYYSDTGDAGPFEPLYVHPSRNAHTYNDTSAPSDGSERHYFVEVSLAGMETFTSSTISGFRAVDALVTTQTPSEISVHGAKFHGTLVELGHPAPTEHGFCYGSMFSPDHFNGATCTKLGPINAVGAFEQDISGLLVNTEYWARAYVTNSTGIHYGDEQDFWTQSPCDFTNTELNVGQGTEQDPYEICTAAQLNKIGTNASYLSAHYRLVYHIDLDGVNFNVIDNFSGVFDGNGYTVSNLHVDLSGIEHVGMFGYVNGATIKDLGLINVNIYGNASVGGLAGALLDGTITGSYVRGNINGNWYVGGLVGEASGDSVVTSSYSEGYVGGDSYVGGLVGNLLGNSVVSESYSSTMTEASGDYYGRLVGRSSGTITNGYYNEDAACTAGCNDLGEALSEAQMTSQEESVFSGFDFIADWKLAGCGMPHLIWEDTECEESLVAPTLVATAQVNAIQLDWSLVDGAETYRLYRKGSGDATYALLGEFDDQVTTYVDTTASGGSPEQVVVTSPAQKHMNYILLEWEAPGATVGEFYDYVMIVENAAGSESPASLPESSAALGSEVSYYEIEVDASGTWLNVGNVLSYLDFDADAAELQLGSLYVENASSLTVVPLWSGAAHQEEGTSHGYRVRAVNLDADNAPQAGPDSYVTHSYRILDNITYQWQRTADDSPDSEFLDLSLVCANALSCEDDTAVMGEGYYYRIAVSAEGAQTVYSSSQFGALAVPALAFAEEPPATVAAGSNFSVAVRVVNQYGMPALAEGVEITLTLNGGTFAEGSTQVSAFTDTQGLALFADLNIEQLGEDFQLIASTEDAPFAELTSVDSELFEVVDTPVSAEFSSITGHSGTLADGVDEAMIVVQLRDANQSAVTGVVPTFSATFDAHNTYLSCSPTDGRGFSYCSMTTTMAGTQTLHLTSPVSKTGGEITFEFSCGGSDFQQGDGETTPYMICNAEQLYKLSTSSEYWDKWFVLADDIDLSDLDEQELQIIGNEVTPFNGIFDGGGFTITGLGIDYPGEFVGFFGYVNGGVIKDVGLVDVDVTGVASVGGLVGALIDGTVSGSFVRGHVEGSWNVGALVGEVSGTSIVASSYAEANVFGGDNAGGLVGGMYGQSELSTSYSLSSVQGTGSNYGRLVGTSVATIASSYYNSEAACGRDCNSLGSALTYEEMTSLDDAKFAGFDFIDEWKWAECGTPLLIWEDTSESECGPECDESATTLNVGDGTVQNPYEICNATQLNLIGLNSNYQHSHFKLVNHIDLQGVDFNMIHNFAGTFDGNGFTISNLTINKPDTWAVGMFSYAPGTTIRDLGLINVQIVGQENVGGLVGLFMNGGTVLRSYATGSVTATNHTAGGLVGGLYDGSSIVDSFAEGSVSGAYSGGLVGMASNASITRSYARGTVDGGTNVGGLVGDTAHLGVAGTGVTIYSSYADSQVSGTSNVGGLVGNFSEHSSITNSYASASVEASGANFGPLAGNVAGNVTHSYYNSEMACTNGCNTTGVDLTEVEMTSQDDSYFAGFHFLTEWKWAGCGMPRLIWEDVSEVCEGGNPGDGGGDTGGEIETPVEFSATGQVNAIALTWNPVTGADKYRIYRKEPFQTGYSLLTEVGGHLTFYVDNDAQGGIPAQIILTTPTEKHADYVLLEWENPGVGYGGIYEYVIAAVDAESNESELSEPAATAPSGGDIVAYELEVDGSGNWTNLGNVLFYEDYDAEPGSLVPSTPVASFATDASAVHLSSQPAQSIESATRSYRVRAVNLNAHGSEQAGLASESVEGNRTVENISYQWQRTDDANPESEYFDLSLGCANELSCADDTAVPGETYYYRLALNADGSDTVYSSSVFGTLAVLELEFISAPNGTIAAESQFGAAVQIVNQYGGDIYVADVEITLSLNSGTFATGSNAVSVLTNGEGTAYFEGLSITEAGVGYQLTASTGHALFGENNSVDGWPFNVDNVQFSTEFSSITGQSGKKADGMDEASIYITLKDELDHPVVGIVPEFSATFDADNQYGACTPTNASGESACTLSTTQSGTQTLSLISPVSLTGGTITFDFACVGSDFLEGNGETEPYAICNAAQLNSIGADSELWDKWFVLTDHIDMAQLGGVNFNVIGDDMTAFSGVFDGSGYTIKNIIIDHDAEYAGMFGYVDGGTIEDVGLIDAYVTASSSVGGLVGYLQSGTVTGSYVRGGSINGFRSVGGLVGEVSGTSLIASSYSNTLVYGDSNVGGLLGAITGESELESSYALSDVQATGFGYGRLVGASGATITSSYYNSDAACGASCNTLGTALSYEDMAAQNESKFAGFDFIDDWKFIGCYAPLLSWEDTSKIECPCDESNTELNVGDGTAENPYEICTADQLNKIGTDFSYASAHFKLVNHIDMQNITYTMIPNFYGVFDGNGYTISNLLVNHESLEHVGMFGYVDGGTIKNLGLDPVYVFGNASVGGLAGALHNGTITGVYVKGYIQGNWYVGGLIGEVSGESLVSTSYSELYVGGGSFVGGLVGNLLGTSEVRESYTSTMTEASGSDFGRLVGSSSATITNSYYNSDAACTAGCNDVGSALSETEMASQDSSKLTGFDFATEWQWAGCGMPRLLWEDVSAACE